MFASRGRHDDGSCTAQQMPVIDEGWIECGLELIRHGRQDIGTQKPDSGRKPIAMAAGRNFLTQGIDLGRIGQFMNELSISIDDARNW